MFNDLAGSKLRRSLMQGDHLSMQNSIEVRFPYLNKELVNFSYSLPDKYLIKKNNGKFILRELFKNKFFKTKKRPLQNPQTKWMNEFILNDLLKDIKKNNLFFEFKIFKKEELLSFLKTEKNNSILTWRILVVQNFLTLFKEIL